MHQKTALQVFTTLLIVGLITPCTRAQDDHERMENKQKASVEDVKVGTVPPDAKIEATLQDGPSATWKVIEDSSASVHRLSARRELIDLRNLEKVIARRPLLIAHRGGVITSVIPECSLAAIRAASQFGYDLVELDIQESADGEPFVFHDDSLDEACGVEGTVATLTAKKLESITFSANGEPIPHLQDSLALCAAERLGVMLDIKPAGGEAFFKRIIGLLERHQLIRATLCIGNAASVRPYFGDRIMLRVGKMELASLEDDDASDLSGKFWFGLPRILPSEMVAKYQERGLLVIPALNTFRYEEEGHRGDAKADSIRLRNASVDGFQIDSVYQDFFRPKVPK